jgi:hypothetical protein
MNSDADMTDRSADGAEMEYEAEDDVGTRIALDEDTLVPLTGGDDDLPIDDEAVMAEAWDNPVEAPADVDLDVDIADDVADGVRDPFVDDHPGYASPPRTQEAGPQIQAIGRSAREPTTPTEEKQQSPSDSRDVGPSQHSEEARVSERRQSEDNRHQEEVHPNEGRTLASQDQKPENGNGQSQSQRVENKGRNVSSLKQHQTQETNTGSNVEQVNEVDIEEKSDKGIEVRVGQQNRGPEEGSDETPVKQANQINVFTRDADTASKTQSALIMKRPELKKQLLSDVPYTYDGDFQDGEDSTSEDIEPAPPILLSYRDQLFSLFAPWTADEVSYPVLLQSREHHKAYFDHLESLFQELHELFPSFEEDQMEMRLCVDILGLEIPEVSSSSSNVN